MSNLEDLRPNASIQGILPNCLVTVVSAQWFGSEALELTYKDPGGKVANELLYRHDEPRIAVAAQGRPWSFDGDEYLFRLVSEGHRQLGGAEQIHDRKHVIAEAAAVCVMGQDVDSTVVVHEPVEDMDRFAGGAGDDLYMEGRIAIRDVRVELDDRVAAPICSCKLEPTPSTVLFGLSSSDGIRVWPMTTPRTPNRRRRNRPTDPDAPGWHNRKRRRELAYRE